MANGTGGVTAPTNYGGSGAANTNQGSGVAKGRPKTRMRNGKKEYRWKNGTWHSRRQGAQFRSNAKPPSGGGGGNGNGTGGTTAPSGPDAAHTPGTAAYRKLHPFLIQAQNDARLAYGGAEQSLNQRAAAIPSWFQNYQNQITAAQQQQANYAAPITQQAQQRATDAGQVAPGAGGDGQAGHDAQLAAAARQALGEAFVTTLQGIGQAQNSYFADRKAAAGAAQVGAQQDLAKDRTALAKEKGAYIATQRAQHKSDAHRQKLEDMAFGLDVQKEANDQANAAADRKAKQKQANNEVITSGPFAGFTKGEVRKMSPEKKAQLRKKSTKPGAVITSGAFAGYTQAQLRGMSQAKKQQLIKAYQQHGGSGGSGSSFTPTQVRASRSQVRKGIAAVKSQIAVPGYKPEGFWNRAYKGLVNEKGYDPELARAVIQIMRHGQVSAGLRKRLKRDFGITGDAFRGKKVNLPPGASEVPVVGGIIGIGGI